MVKTKWRIPFENRTINGPKNDHLNTGQSGIRRGTVFPGLKNVAKKL
jgi:hypothetical protein